jgi:hypothetical protein
MEEGVMGLSVAVDMAMVSVLADSKLLTTIRVVASKVAIIARHCLLDTRDILALLTLG